MERIKRGSSRGRDKDEAERGIGEYGEEQMRMRGRYRYSVVSKL